LLTTPQEDTDPNIIIAEGFLLLEDPTTADLIDHVIEITVGKEIAWQRRLKRALHMARAGNKNGEWPEGVANPDNYEQLHYYAMKEDVLSIQADAHAAASVIGPELIYPQQNHVGIDLSVATGEYDWMRLYFDELVWPSAARVSARVQELKRERQGLVHTISGEGSVEEVARAASDCAQRIVAADVGLGSRL
jgi:hypothetical protein